MLRTTLTSPQPIVVHASEELTACRACLITDTKLYNLHEWRLAQPFEVLTGIPVSMMDGLPQHICYVCHAQLQNCAAFLAKCHRAHIALQDVKAKSRKITTFNIRRLNTTNLNLHFTKTDTLTLDYIPGSNPQSLAAVKVQNDGHVQLPAEVDVIDDDDEQSIAEVESQDDHDVKLVHCNNFGTETYFIKKSDEKENKDAMNNFQTDNLSTKENKIEELKICSDTFSSNETSLSNIQEQENIEEFNFEFTIVPEVDGKCEDGSGTNKSSKIRKNTENEDGKRLFLIINPITKKPNCLKDEDTKTPQEIKVKRKCARKEPGQLCNLKTKEDFAEFSKLYDVEVMIYTIEEQIKLRQEQKNSARYQAARYKCEHCFTGFVLETPFNNHMKCHDPSRGSLVCEVCKFRFPSDRKEQFRAHCRMHQKRFFCKLCNHWSKNSNSAKVHHKWHQGFKYQCKDCDKCFETLKAHLGHCREKHTPQICNLCQETFAGVQKLYKHMALMHALNPGKQLEAERRRANAADERKMLMCEWCGKRFRVTMELKNHHLVHTGEKPHKCPECPKSFRLQLSLTIHMTTHTGARPYQCPHCPKAFRQHAQRIVHLRTHTKEKPYKCDICQKGFVTGATRRAHVATVHMGQAPRQRNRQREKMNRLNKIKNKYE